jgi:hypothetical protein
MGVFDNVKCLYPTPWPDSKEWEWQTKDTPAQYLDDYEVREDGTLWHKEYDVEDHSDPHATGLKAMIGCMTRVNERWVQDRDFTGQLEIHDGDFSIIFWIRNGQVKDAVFYEREEEISAGGDSREPEIPMPPMLPGETPEQYTNRLTGADGTNRVPYQEKRFRQCSIGHHDECSDHEGKECQCPCHKKKEPR